MALVVVVCSYRSGCKSQSPTWHLIPKFAGKACDPLNVLDSRKMNGKCAIDKLVLEKAKMLFRASESVFHSKIKNIPWFL